jgi:pimeloyl-ACP methyl ester carboxylesterase
MQVALDGVARRVQVLRDGDALHVALGGPEAGEAAYRFFEEPSMQTVAAYLRLAFPYVMGAPAATTALVQPDWNLDLAVEWTRTEMRTIDLRDDLPAIEAPTLIVAGDSDPQNPRSAVEEVVAGLRDARTVWFRGARHSVWRDAPDSLTVIRDFVAAR